MTKLVSREDVKNGPPPTQKADSTFLQSFNNVNRKLETQLQKANKLRKQNILKVENNVGRKVLRLPIGPLIRGAEQEKYGGKFNK